MGLIYSWFARTMHGSDTDSDGTDGLVSDGPITLGRVSRNTRSSRRTASQSANPDISSSTSQQSVFYRLLNLVRSSNTSHLPRRSNALPQDDVSDPDDVDRSRSRSCSPAPLPPGCSSDSQTKTDLYDYAREYCNDIFTAVALDSGEAGFAPQRGQFQGPFGAVQKRELGLHRTCSFTPGNKCALQNCFLPNRMKKLVKYRSKAFCAQYVRDGDLFVSACQDQKLRFYDTSKGRFKEFRSVEAHDVGWSIVDVAVSPDGLHAVYSSWSDYIHQCNIYGPMENHVAFHMMPREPRFCVFSLRFSCDGCEILAGASDRCLYVYNREQKMRTLRFKAHEDDVNAICFADSSSNIVYSAGDDGLCKVWDRRTLSEENPLPVGIFAGHSDGITFIDTKGDARFLITNSKDQSIKLWDLRRFSAADGFETARKAVAGQTWDYRWQSVPRKVSKVRPKLRGDTSVMTYYGHTVLHTLIRAYFSPVVCSGQRYIYSGSATGACFIYDVLTGAVVARLRGHQSCVRDVSWHPLQNEICTSSWDGYLGLWTYSGRKANQSPGGSDSEDSGDDEDVITSRFGRERDAHQSRGRGRPLRPHLLRVITGQGQQSVVGGVIDDMESHPRQ